MKRKEMKEKGEEMVASPFQKAMRDKLTTRDERERLSAVALTHGSRIGVTCGARKEPPVAARR